MKFKIWILFSLIMFIKMKNITMKCIKCDGFGLPNVLKVGEYPFPSIKANHIIIKVKATAINRADTLQR